MRQPFGLVPIVLNLSACSTIASTNSLFLQASNIGICLHCLDTEVKLGREGVEDKVSGRKMNLSGYYSHCLGNTLTRKSNSAGRVSRMRKTVSRHHHAYSQSQNHRRGS
jgi:hypothetical protein